MDFQDQGVSTLSESIYMIVGALLNLLGGIMTLVRHSQRSEFASWTYVTSYLNTHTKNMDLGLGIVAILAGAVMLGDFILGVFA